MAIYSNGQVGWFSGIAAPSSLLTNLYAVYKADTTVTSLNTNLFATYKGESNANDSLGTYNGTAQGGLTYTTGKSGNAFLFNGSNAYVELPNNMFNSFTGDFSISVWVNFGVLSGAKDILSSFTFFGNNYYGFELYSNGTGIKFSTYNGTTTIVDLPSAGAPLSTNTWYNIIITRKASTGTKMYINGTLNNSNTSTQNPVYTATNYATIGGSNFGGSYTNLAGNGTKIDELNIWNKELTASEVTDLYNSGTGKFYPTF